jgi:hypothetical chaperone protein
MDFGTTNSGMAVYDGQQLHHIPLDPASTNPHVVRSALYITNDRATHIGRQAIETYYQQNLGRPSKYEQVRVGEIELTFAELPSFIRDVYVEKDVFSPGRLFLSFKMGLSSPNYLGTLVGTDYFFLETIIATYLYITRKRAEAFLDTELDTIVLGRPVRYSDDPIQNDFARERLLQAAFRAGYKTVYLEYEPVAAAYYYETFINHEQNVLIFDFGGGTLDISILRLGNPKTRRVLATGGIAIAGDVFDQKIVRAKLPPHLGEGETYRAGRNDLPIPSSYYSAFSNWQDLLGLQSRDRLENLRRIERSAQNPNKIRTLLKLIESNYSLKIFDLAETGKRALSNSQQTSLLFNGPGFTIHETLTRLEFENLIHSDIRAISQRLDAVVREAGLNNNQIDAVIRTGGSSQIPAFIQLLEQRFGAGKVRDIDTFSSVTAGLGIVAHQVQTGSAALTAHTPEGHPTPDYLLSKKQGGIPVIDLELLKKLMDIKEQENQSHEQAVVILGIADKGGISAASLSDMEHSRSTLKHPAELQPPADAFWLHERVLLATTEYRFLVRSVRELADLSAAHLDFATIENFHKDSFGQEMVCVLARWSAFEKARPLAAITTRGYGRLMAGEAFVNRLNQRIPYQMSRSRGYPAAILPVSEQGELVIISHTGRAIRMPVAQLSTLEERLIQLPPESRVIGAFCLEQPCELLIATANGHIERLHSTDIPLTTALNTTGTKLVSRSQPVIAKLHQPGCPWWAITNRRVIEIKQKTDQPTISYKLAHLESGERVISIFCAPSL